MSSSPRSSHRMGKKPSIGFLSHVLHLCTHTPTNNPTCMTPTTTHPHSHTHTQTDAGKLWFIQIHIHAPWPGRKLGILYHRQEEHSLQVIHVRSALILFWWIAQIRRTRTLCEWMCVCSLINIPFKNKPKQTRSEWGEVRVLLSCWSVSQRCTFCRAMTHIFC